MALLISEKYPCEVSEDGYRLIGAFENDGESGNKKQQSYLIERTDSEIILSEAIRQSSPTGYNPLEVDALFYNFAYLENIESSILAFANQYGFLGAGITKTVTIDGSHSFDGEAITKWYEQISKLREAIELWNDIQSENQANLGKKVSIMRVNKETVYCSFKGVTLLTGKKIIDVNSPLFQQGMDGNYIAIARYFLKDAINREFSTGLSARMVLAGDKNLTLVFMPSSLLAALWIQFANAIAEERHFKQCLECGKWFSLPIGRGRKDKLYCSNGCNVKAYRKRKEEVMRLHNEGMPINKIAKKLDLEIEQIKKWTEAL